MSFARVIRWATVSASLSAYRRILNQQDPPSADKTHQVVSSRQHTHWGLKSRQVNWQKKATVVFPIPNMKDSSRR